MYIFLSTSYWLVGEKYDELFQKKKRKYKGKEVEKRGERGNFMLEKKGKGK